MVAAGMNVIVPSLVIALVLYWLAVRLYNDWVFLRYPRLNALGTVIGHRRIKDDGGQLSLPIIRFESDVGRTVEFTNAWGSRAHELAVGSPVAVEYPLGLPHKARIPGSYSPFLAYGLFVVVLAALVVVLVAPGMSKRQPLGSKADASSDRDMDFAHRPAITATGPPPGGP
jgi:hypothetical protein